MGCEEMKNIDFEDNLGFAISTIFNGEQLQDMRNHLDDLQRKAELYDKHKDDIELGLAVKWDMGEDSLYLDDVLEEYRQQKV